MTKDKRYYEKNYDELYYIFDSKTLSEEEFEKKVEYDDYDVFADSLTSKEVLDLLNENEKLREEKYAYLGEITLYNGESTKRKKENEKLKQENEELKRENEYLQQKIEDLSYENIEMLKNTIARNEAYIKRMKHKGEWIK